MYTCTLILPDLNSKIWFVAYFGIDLLELNKFDEKAELIYESHKEE